MTVTCCAACAHNYALEWSDSYGGWLCSACLESQKEYDAAEPTPPTPRVRVSESSPCPDCGDTYPHYHLQPQPLVGYNFKFKAIVTDPIDWQKRLDEFLDEHK